MGSEVIVDETASKTDASVNNMATSTAESDADIEIQEPHIPFTDLDTYVEKDLPESLDNSSELSYKNVKIKEEPKDEDEDDGFEEVGTVLIATDEEITINSEETQSQLIDAANNGEFDAPATPTQVEAGEEITNQDVIETHAAGIDANLEPEDKLNLSAAAANHAPVIPLANLVNKIKINITKNTNNNSNNATNTTTTATGNTNSTVSNSIQQQQQAGESISTISGTATATSKNAAGDVDHMPTTDGCSGVLSASSVTALPAVPIEEIITYEVKPALKNAPLKKMKKVECGVETSGLCSIM